MMGESLEAVASITCCLLAPVDSFTSIPFPCVFFNDAKAAGFTDLGRPSLFEKTP